MAQTANAAWLALPRSSAVGWVPLTQDTFDTPYHEELSAEDQVAKKIEIDRKLIFNISGRHYEVSEYLLNRYPFTLLGCEDREKFYRAETKEYFFDRDPEFFRYVLLFYRQGFTHFPRNECSSAFEDEMGFYRIDMEDLNPCCYEVYEDFHQETLERLADIENESVPKRNTKFDNLVMGKIRYKVHEAFENPTSSLLAQVIYYVSGFFIAISVLANILETIPGSYSITKGKWTNLGVIYEPIFSCLDATCVIIFTIEYMFRLFGSPEPSKFIRSIMSIIDVVAILPFYIGLMMPDNKEVSGAFTTLRVFRVFRIFKFSRHSTGLRILGQTLQACARELGFLLFTLTMAIVIFSTIIYYLEKSVHNTNFTSIPSAFWYTIVTMTTLGYGDMVPVTLMGRLVGSICSLSGVLVIALPVPVIVSNFSRIYTQSQRSEKRREQRRLRQAKVEMRQLFMKTQSKENQTEASDTLTLQQQRQQQHHQHQLMQQQHLQQQLHQQQPLTQHHRYSILSQQHQTEQESPTVATHQAIKPLPSPQKTVSLASLESLTPSSSFSSNDINQTDTQNPTAIIHSRNNNIDSFHHHHHHHHHQDHHHHHHHQQPKKQHHSPEKKIFNKRKCNQARYSNNDENH